MLISKLKLNQISSGVSKKRPKPLNHFNIQTVMILLSVLTRQRCFLIDYCKCIRKRLKARLQQHSKKNLDVCSDNKNMNVFNNSNTIPLFTLTHRMAELKTSRALAQKSFMGKRLVDAAKCYRALEKCVRLTLRWVLSEEPMKKEIKSFSSCSVHCTNSKFAPSQMSSWDPSELRHKAGP